MHIALALIAVLGFLLWVISLAVPAIGPITPGQTIPTNYILFPLGITLNVTPLFALAGKR